MTSQRRALTQLGGRIETQGEPTTGRSLAAIWERASSASPDRLTHPFHAYPARMHPELPRALLEAHPDALVVLDPFVGSGTVLVEALAAGRRGLGADINPIALRIAWAKTRVLDPGSLGELAQRAAQISAEAFARARARAPVQLSEAARSQREWYAPHVLLELQTLWDLIAEVDDPEQRELLRMFFSTLVVKVSWQASDSHSERVERQIGRGTTSRLFGDKARVLMEMLAELSSQVPLDTPEVDLFHVDARDLTPVGSRAVDLVITSPPYPGTYNYLHHQDRRLAWFGEDTALTDEGELGARRHRDHLGEQGAWQRWQRDQRRWLQVMKRVVKPTGWIYLVLGDSVLGGRPWWAEEEIAAAAHEVGLTPVAVASQHRPNTHEEMARAFGARPRREHLIALRREEAPYG